VVDPGGLSKMKSSSPPSQPKLRKVGNKPGNATLQENSVFLCSP
jgi:hypothetical protein